MTAQKTVGKEGIFVMRGICNGMVMQRNCYDVSEIYLQEPFETAFYFGQVSGQVCAIKTDRGYCLTGIPVGGPYCVQINGEVYSDIYVGDVWMLAGQSNMEGLGLVSEKDRQMIPDPEVRAFYMDNVWRPAKHLLSEPKRSVYLVHRKSPQAVEDKGMRGVGPGLSFGQEMKRHTGGIPQGLICAALSASSMNDWDPDIRDQGTDDSLYAAMLDRFVCNGSHIRGLFWYQGCSDATDELYPFFAEKMKKFIGAVRTDLGKDLPIVQVQIGPVHQSLREYENAWNHIRMHQYEMTQQYDNLDTITAINKDLEDFIHLSNASQVQIGKEAAESMAKLILPDREDLLPAPRMKSVWIDTGIQPEFLTICVSFDHLHGGLKSEGRAWGFSLTNTPGVVDDDSVLTVRLQGNTALIRTELTKDEARKKYLYYGWGQTTYCNLTDESGRAIPAFGPVSLEY